MAATGSSTVVIYLVDGVIHLSNNAGGNFKFKRVILPIYQVIFFFVALWHSWHGMVHLKLEFKS